MGNAATASRLARRFMNLIPDRVTRGRNNIYGQSQPYKFLDETNECALRMRVPFIHGNALGLLGGGLGGEHCTNQLVNLISTQGSGDIVVGNCPSKKKVTVMGNGTGFPGENGPHYFYLTERQPDGTATHWNPAYAPLREDLDAGECIVGQGKQTFLALKNGIGSQLTVFEPLDRNCAVRVLDLYNDGDTPRTIEVIGFVPFQRWSGAHQNNRQREDSITRIEADHRADETTIYHVSRLAERGKMFSFVHDYSPAEKICTDLHRFAGVDQSLQTPDALFDPNYEWDERESRDGEPISAMKHIFVIPPHGKQRLVSLIGWHEFPDHKGKLDPETLRANTAPAREIIDQFRTIEAIETSLGDVETAYANFRSTLQVQTPDPVFNRMIGSWNPYDLLFNATFSRGKSFVDTNPEARGMGYRDSNQDLLGLAGLVARKWVEQRITDLAGTHDTKGGMSHAYDPFSKTGDDRIGSKFSDDKCWLTLSVAQFCKETGDPTILDRQVGFQSDPEHPELTKDQIPPASILEHIRRSMLAVLGLLGPHGLPLSLRADWNDCHNYNEALTEFEESWQGGTNGPSDVAESVLTAGLWIYSARLLSDMLRWKANFVGEEQAAQLRIEAAFWDGKREEMEANAETFTWDANLHAGGGQHYIRAYDAESRPIGTDLDPDGQACADGIAWAALARIGEQHGWPRLAMETVKQRLFDPRYGIELNTPAFPYGSYWARRMGECRSYPPGTKENASVFNHANTWYIVLACTLGDAEFAYAVYKAITSAYLDAPSYLHRGSEPYTYSQMVTGRAHAEPGKAKNPLISGTVAWNYVGATQYMMGIRPEFKGLTIDPCLPKEWREQAEVVTAQREFRGDKFMIEIHTSLDTAKGVQKMTVNGQTMDGNFIPDTMIKGDGTVHNVEVIMGEAS